jgi:hypothetical protein
MKSKIFKFARSALWWHKHRINVYSCRKHKMLLNTKF